MLVEAGGEEDHQPHPKTLKHSTSSTDVGTPTMPDIPTVFIKSRHDDLFTLIICLILLSVPMVQLQASLYLSSTQMTSLEGPSYNLLETIGRG